MPMGIGKEIYGDVFHVENLEILNIEKSMPMGIGKAIYCDVFHVENLEILNIETCACGDGKVIYLLIY